MTRNFKGQTEAYYIALAGVNWAIGELIRNEVIPPEMKVDKLFEKDEELQEEETRWRINTDIPPGHYGEGQFEVWIGNERGKININGANEALLKMMLKGFDLEGQQESIIVDSIMDWRDKNDLHRLNGAEDDYYKSLPEPYECKNGDFDSVEELLMVRGVTPEIFYGGLRDIVTVFKRPTLRTRVGQGYKVVSSDLNKININAAPKKVLLALPAMTGDLAQEIINYRKESDFRVLTDVSSLLGGDVYNAIAPYITLETSPYYSIMSVGKLADSKIKQGVNALVEIDKRLKKGYRVVQWRDSLQSQDEIHLTSEKE